MVKLIKALSLLETWKRCFVTMLASCMSFINSLMVIDYTLLYGKNDPSNVTSRNMEEVFVSMLA